jgi:hypothetical protein
MTNDPTPGRTYKDYEALAEEAYEQISESFRNPAGCWSDCKEWFAFAIGAAWREGLTSEVDRLTARFEELKKHYRNQF